MVNREETVVGERTDFGLKLASQRATVRRNRAAFSCKLQEIQRSERFHLSHVMLHGSEMVVWQNPTRNKESVEKDRF